MRFDVTPANQATRVWGVVRLMFLLVTAVLLQACATVKSPDPRDPIESFNRSMFGFNDAVDKAVLKPVATVYQKATPSLVRKGVGNFFNNLEDVWSTFNNAIAFKGSATGSSFGRVMVNSTLGIGGVIDIASDLNIERYPADFGLTLGRWGVSPGPYVVLPVLGSFTLREVFALPVDQQGSLVVHVPDLPTRYGLTVLNLVDVRAQFLKAGEVVEGAALDKYSFTRDAYFQRQRYRQYDGNPPEEESPE